MAQPSSSSSSSGWRTANNASLPASMEQSFKLATPPRTDIWRPDESASVFTAPVIYRTLKASEFKRIEVTVFASWKTQYDQGGLILAFPGPEDAKSEGAVDPPKWIKAGIEYFKSAPSFGVVGTDRFSDWSLSPMRSDLHQKARVVLERDGTTLWVYASQLGEDSDEGEGTLTPLREVKWAFLEDRQSDADVWVGVYAAKPTPEADENEDKAFEVSFEGLKIEVNE